VQREQTKHENEREHLQTFEKALHLSSLIIIIIIVIIIASFLHRSRRRSRRGRKVIVIPANTNVPPMVSPPSVITRINHNTRFNVVYEYYVKPCSKSYASSSSFKRDTVLLKRRWKRKSDDEKLVRTLFSLKRKSSRKAKFPFFFRRRCETFLRKSSRKAFVRVRRAENCVCVLLLSFFFFFLTRREKRVRDNSRRVLLKSFEERKSREDDDKSEDEQKCHREPTEEEEKRERNANANSSWKKRERKV